MYRPNPSVAKLRRTEFRSLADIVQDAARELGEFVYLAWSTDDPAERAIALDGAIRCLATGTAYLAVLRQVAEPTADDPDSF